MRLWNRKRRTLRRNGVLRFIADLSHESVATDKVPDFAVESVSVVFSSSCMGVLIVLNVSSIWSRAFLVFLSSATQATWLLTNKSASPVLVRL